MTQTQTPYGRDPDPDSGLSVAQTGVTQTQTGLFIVGTRTRTDTPARTQTIPNARTQTTRTGPGPGGPDDTRTDTGPGPGGPGPDGTQTTQTTQTAPTPDGSETAAGPGPGGPGPGDTRTAQTRTWTVDPRAAVTEARVKATKARSWAARGGYISALTAIVAVIAALGQKQFATTENFVNQLKIGTYDLTPWLAPAAFDLAVAALLHGGLRAGKDRLSPWPWWAAAAGVAGLSIYTNAQHAGAKITASASGVLFLIWGLYLFTEYKKIIRARELEDSSADTLVSTDVLFDVDRELAQRAWLIARTKPLAAAVTFRHRLGETQLTERDVAMMAARLYLDIYNDQLWVLLNPVVTPAKEDGTPEKRRRIRRWHRALWKRAHWVADLTASDAVHAYLGMPVPERSGVKVARVTYAVQEDAPVLGAVRTPARSIATAAAPAAPELTAAPSATAELPASPPVRRRRAIAAPPVDQAEPPARDQLDDEPQPDLEPDDEPETITVIVPKGVAGQNWVPLEKIPGLPEIDPELACECHSDPSKRCGRTLVEHVQRRGKQIVEIIAKVPDWAGREERIGKSLIRQHAGVGGSGAQIEIAAVFDQVRAIAQRGGRPAPEPAAIDLIEAPEPVSADS